MKQLGSHWTDFHEILYLSIFRKSIEKSQVSLKSDKKYRLLYDDQYTLLITTHSVFLRIRNVSDQSCGDSQNTNFMFNIFSPENRAFMR
jgi:hypothetical protein